MNTLHTFTFDGSWNQIKGQLRQKFALLTDDDLEFLEGKGEELLGRLKTKLGLTEEALIELLNHLKEVATDFAGDVKAKVGGAAGDVYEHTRQRVRTLHDEAEDYVTQQPRKALLMALAAGFVAGLLIRR